MEITEEQRKIALVDVARFARAATELGYAEAVAIAEAVIAEVLPMRPHPVHTHHAGPVCLYWHDNGPTHPEDPGDCIHNSCWRIMHERCEGCEIETGVEMALDMARFGQRKLMFANGWCPYCRTVLTCTGSYGAPGCGRHWVCTGGNPEGDVHHWSEARGMVFRADEGAHILSAGDVR
jgi:hypothetical protein